MDKKKLIPQMIEQLEQDLLAVKEAARATHDAATNEESQPENQYDTRALEASYLAGAQAKRAAEIDEVLSTFKTTSFRDFAASDVIASTALVEVSHAGKKTILLVMPRGGGVKVSVDGKSVQVVTPNSNLGEALLGLKVGDTAEFEVGPSVHEYQILSIS